MKIYRSDMSIIADVEIDDGTMSFTIMPDPLDPLRYHICSPFANDYEGLVFIENSSNNKIQFVKYDRYLYKKVEGKIL